MSSLDASALTQDPDGLAALRDVLGPASVRPSLAAAFCSEAEAVQDGTEWMAANASPERVLASLLN